MKKIFISAIFLFTILINLNAQEKVSSIIFEKLTYEKALLKAKTSGKLLYIYFTDPLCSACKKMENTTFKNQEIIDLFNSSFINLKLEDNPNFNKLLRKKLGLTRIPTHIFVNAKEEIAHKVTGPLDVSQFIEMGRIALNPEENLLGLKTIYLKDAKKMGNPRMLNYIMTLYHASEDYKSVARYYFDNLNEGDYNDQDVLKSAYLLASDIYSIEFKMMVMRIKELDLGIPREEINFHINEMLTNQAIKAEKQNAKVHYRDTLIRICNYLSYPMEQPLIMWSELIHSREIPDGDNNYFERLSSFMEAYSNMIPVSRKLDMYSDIAENCKDLRIKEYSIRGLQYTFEQKQNPEILIILSYSLYNFGRIEESRAMMDTAEQFAKDQSLDIGDQINYYRKKMNLQEEKK